jgi:hypothetical protein
MNVVYMIRPRRMTMDQIKNMEVGSVPDVFAKGELKTTLSMSVGSLLVWCGLSQHPEVKGP